MHFDAIWLLSFTKTNRSFRNTSRKTSSGDISLGNPYDKRAFARNQPNSSKVLTAFRAMERTDFFGNASKQTAADRAVLFPAGIVESAVSKSNPSSNY
ncbi:hypothetical protein CDAR_569451 [Caerostris darwini]|uniref:Uncharacterized protein n=1 Tax=Caerostris darwini TaxID=1538125 RepID=A0AAV4V7E5_9ARAC|nr:hypothetical protein CDAR_569451 [Caerostris darwini]